MSKLEVARETFDRMAVVMRDSLTEEKMVGLDELKKSSSDKVKDEIFDLVPEELRKEALASVQGLTDLECLEVAKQLHSRNGFPETLHWIMCSFLTCPFWKDFIQAASRGKKDPGTPVPDPEIRNPEE